MNKIALLLAALAIASVSSLEVTPYVKSLQEKMVNAFFESLQGPGDFDFAPHSPSTISSPLIWKITANCSVTGIDGGLASANLSARMLKGSGAINGHDIGGGYQLDVTNGQSFSITAGALAKVEITNNANQTVHASCGLNASETVEDFNDMLQTVLNLDLHFMRN